jgi:hypothetical protein
MVMVWMLGFYCRQTEGSEMSHLRDASPPQAPVQHDETPAINPFLNILKVEDLN